MASNDLSKKISTDHGETIKQRLNSQIHVNDKCLECVAELSKTFVDTLKMTSYLFSCLSSDEGTDDKDGRQIDRLVSVMVCQHDDQEDNWCFLKGNCLKNHLLQMGLNDKYKLMRDTCNSVTGEEFLNIEYESARSYLNLWFNAVEWANEGLPLSESIDMEKCSKDQINKLADAVHKYLNGTLGFKNIQMRHFFQSRGDRNQIVNENRVAAHLETLFSQHRQKLVRENETDETDRKKKVHMILGVHPRK